MQFSPAETEISAQSIPTHTTDQIKTNVYRKFVKRGLDIFLTLLAAPIIVPVVAVMALLIMMDGHNPFYSQMRVGRKGRAFRMWKLRTMVPNADELLETYLSSNPKARAEWTSTQKLKNDPRITWIGSMLRKTSADELPQLLNVLLGTMSLVGPRPMMVSQRKDYTGLSYFNLTPGVTGPWQVADRNHCQFVDRVKFDDSYERSISFGTDVQILLKTVSVVFRGTGY